MAALIAAPIAAWLAALPLGCQHRVAIPQIADLSASAPRWPRAPDPARVAHLGALTMSEPGLRRPLDVGCSGDKLAIADPDAGRVWLVDLGRERVRRAPGGPNAPRQPVGVSVTAGGVWVADAALKRIVVLEDGRRRWRALDLDAPLQRPTATTLLPDRRIVVVDTAAHRILTVDPDTGSVDAGPARGEAGEGFNFPVDVVTAPTGGVLVADALNAAIQRLPPSGAPAVVAGGSVEGGAALIRPKGLALDRHRRLHVVDGGMQHVQVYDPATGALLGRYGEPGGGPGQLALPSGICIDEDLVYVADSLNRRIQVYALLEEGR